MTPHEAMARALDLAATAPEWVAPPIGAVVLGPDGALLAETVNGRAARAYTELRRAPSGPAR